jgi:hypothetical protein
MQYIKTKNLLKSLSFIILLSTTTESVSGRTIAQYEYVQVQSQDGNVTSALIDYTHKKICIVINSNDELTTKKYKFNGSNRSFLAGNRKYKVTGGKLDVPASHYELIDNSKKCGDPKECILATSITTYYDYRFQKKAGTIPKGNTVNFLGIENNSFDGKASNLEYQGQTLYGKKNPSCKI